MYRLKKVVISILAISVVLLFTVACNDSSSVEKIIKLTENDTVSTNENTEPDIEYDTNSLINIVRNGSLYQYPDILLKKAFGLFIGSIEWDALINDTGFFVKVSGNITMYDEEAAVEIVYEVDPENEVFSFDSVYLDSVAETELFYKLLEYRVMDLYIYGEETVENALINFVKNGTLFDYEDIPLGFAVENWFGSPIWEAILSDDDNYYINIHGTVMQYGEYEEATLQYLVDLDNEIFLFNALEVGGVPQTIDVYSAAISDMMENLKNHLSTAQVAV